MLRSGIDGVLFACGRVRKLFGDRDKLGPDGILKDVVAARFEAFKIANLSFIERWRPDRELAFEPMGEVPLDKLDGFLKRDIWGRSQDCVHVVRHQDEGVKVEAVLGPLFHEYIEEELSVGFDLEETSTICG